MRLWSRRLKTLQRAEVLGGYLIAGVTAEDFGKTSGKINVEQSLVERTEAVRATGLADEIILEEYEGQKIDDIRRYDIDIFTAGSDWVGKFDYLNECCEVVCLDRTQGVSSTEIRSQKQTLKIGFVGSGSVLDKYMKESKLVNGMECSGEVVLDEASDDLDRECSNLIDKSDAVYIATHSDYRPPQIEKTLQSGVHVLCESPIEKAKTNA